MNITKALSSSRGTSNLVSRMGTIFSRFGITSGKFERILDEYSSVTTQAGCTATLPITAAILKRHPDLIRKYNQKGIEFAIHGYVHIDYQNLDGKEQVEHFKKAIATFNNLHVPFTGFRAPYLRINQETPFALSSLGVPYDSSYVVYWNVLQKTHFPRQAWYEYLRLFDFYQARNSLDYLSLPEYAPDERFIEIPVSIPDDEALVERLGITANAGITKIWSDILQQSNRRGELFTLQLHPERIFLCGHALSSVVRQAREMSPKVWITTLTEIARWWKEKWAFNFEIDPEGRGKYHIKANCSPRATVLIRNCSVSSPTTEWKDGYQCMDERDFVVENGKPPIIGVGISSSLAAIRFLRSEGYIVETSEQVDKYGLYLHDLENFQLKDAKSIVEKIEFSDAPLVRFWRWPQKCQSALAVSGDIDSITLLDFALRLVEARQVNKKRKYPAEVVSASASI